LKSITVNQTNKELPNMNPIDRMHVIDKDKIKVNMH